MALVVAGAAYGLWRVAYVPREVVRRYALAHEAYHEGDIQQAVEHLERVHRLDPHQVGANMLLGWSYWRLGHPLDAARLFEEAYEGDPTSFEARSALGMARLALGEAEAAIPPLQQAVRARPGDIEVQLRLAEAYRRSGRNLAAAKLYSELLARDSSNFRAETALLEIFGYPDLNRDVPLTLPKRPRPEELQLQFRTQGDYLQVLDEGRWRSAYLTGVNLGPGRPGEFAVTASLEFGTYRQWLREIAAMNANTVRVYTILPPAFYQAFLAHNREAPEPLWLIQEVWLPAEAINLYDPETLIGFATELKNSIDLLHGQADIACRVGHYCGVYTAHVAQWVIGLGVGREVEPRVVRHTNRMNPGRTSYKGTHVSLDEGSPSEVWFAEMFDLAAAYELDRYNAQRALTVVNWPPLDPMHHPTEATYEEEIRIRRQLGEEVSDSVPEDMNDMDVVTIDVTRFRVEPAFNSGLFALYHVYQHWPDFMFLEPSYAEVEDEEGTNRYLGYLLELKEAHRDFPLLIGEYGLATSLTPAHIHPEGWGNGGLTEEQQAQLLLRFSRNIRDTDMAGGIVFAWLDEWWKQVHDRFAAPMEPRAHDADWLNLLDPEELFGVVGYRPFQRVPLLRGEEADWAQADTLYLRSAAPAADDDTGGGDPSKTLEAVYATSDYAYFYIRLDLRQGGEFDWDGSSIWIALNTLPSRAGSRVLPEANLGLQSGANFVVQLDRASEGRVLVAENYNPWEEWVVPGRPDMTRILTRSDMSVDLGTASFVDMIIEANPPRWARDGREFPSIRFNRSQLTYGTADPDLPGYTSHAVWHVDREAGMVEIRLPWGLILVTDPSQKLVFGGTEAREPVSTSTSAISVAAFVFDVTGEADDRTLALRSAFPDVRRGVPGLRLGAVQGTLSTYTWKGWKEVRYRPYYKPSYYDLQDLWGTWPRFMD